MNAGRLFEDALKAAQLDLRPGVVFRIKVEGRKGRLKLLVTRGAVSEFEATILERRREVDKASLYRTSLSTGERVRILRHEAGLTLEELSSRCGLTRGSLSSIELGKRPVGLQVLRRIAKGLGVSPSALLAD